MTDEQIIRNFRIPLGTAGEMRGLLADIRHTAAETDRLLPPGREKSLAMTKLEECFFWAREAITRNQG